MSHPWPAPGPFREGEQDIAKLKAFLADEMWRLLESCNRLQVAEAFNRTLDADLWFDIFYDFFEACVPYSEVERTARETKRQGTEAEHFFPARAEADEAWKEFASALSRHPGPGSAMEAQLWYELAKRTSEKPTAMALIDDMWRVYASGNETSESMLMQAFIGPAFVLAETHAMRIVLERYPWTDPACVPPDIPALIQSIEEIVASSKAKVAEHGFDNVLYVRGPTSVYEFGLMTTLTGSIIPIVLVGQ